MDRETLELFSMELKELITPCLGRWEYGGLSAYGARGTLPDIGSPVKLWVLNYYRVLEGSGIIIVTYQEATGLFRFEDKVTNSPDEALAYVKKRLEGIKPEREEDIRKDAGKRRRTPREIVMENIRRISQERPNSGPTEEEIVIYERILFER